jgi:Txe/YoeB family toxin of Txe-Axe toxin-antitoxin module
MRQEARAEQRTLADESQKIASETMQVQDQDIQESVSKLLQDIDSDPFLLKILWKHVRDAE